MNILSGNGDLIRFVLMTLGIKSLKIETDKPDTVFTVTYTRYGESQKILMTAKELISLLAEKSDTSKTPDGYHDLRDMQATSETPPDSPRQPQDRAVDPPK